MRILTFNCWQSELLCFPSLLHIKWSAVVVRHDVDWLPGRRLLKSVPDWCLVCPVEGWEERGVRAVPGGQQGHQTGGARPAGPSGVLGAWALQQPPLCGVSDWPYRGLRLRWLRLPSLSPAQALPPNTPGGVRGLHQKWLQTDGRGQTRDGPSLPSSGDDQVSRPDGEEPRDQKRARDVDGSHWRKTGTAGEVYWALQRYHRSAGSGPSTWDRGGDHQDHRVLRRKLPGRAGWLRVLQRSWHLSTGQSDEP